MSVKFNVVGPTGAFANHVRWLVLLDPQFTSIFPKFSLEEFDQLKGPDWPSYENYLKRNLSNIPVSIKQELDQINAYEFVFDTVDNKIKEFENKIYHQSRTWHNWLLVERILREVLTISLNNTVTLMHTIKDKTIGPDEKTLLITIDPKLAHRSYLKFNSNLNNMTKDQFYQHVTRDFDDWQKLVSTDSLHYKIIESDILNQPVLDKQFYNELINWFDLTDLYEQANYVHGLWYEAHRRMENEFINDIRKFYEN